MLKRGRKRSERRRVCVVAAPPRHLRRRICTESFTHPPHSTHIHSLSQARVVIFGSGCLAAEVRLKRWGLTCAFWGCSSLCDPPPTLFHPQIAKNLVLAGVGRLDIVDDGTNLPADAAAAADDPAPRGNFLVAATAEPAPPGTR